MGLAPILPIAARDHQKLSSTPPRSFRFPMRPVLKGIKKMKAIFPDAIGFADELHAKQIDVSQSTDHRGGNRSKARFIMRD
ncbi:hypothetical protein SAMN04515647_2578 [Cohaesibacter sp. ES.047]|nr:hypothetical protein SAMN04515647_2578 [Cohaesibacter sp. ES.047]